MPSHDGDFLPVQEHFSRLVETLNEDDLLVYNSLRHVRVETGFRGRSFVIYRMQGNGLPLVMDRFKITDFACDDLHGASFKLDNLWINYTPQKLGGYAVFLWLPLHLKLRWGAQQIDDGSLAFPIVIRTQSRSHLRGRGVTYCETSTSFAQEFGPNYDE